jgi:hypothetical protein
MIPKLPYHIIPYEVYPFDLLVSYQEYESLETTLKKKLPKDNHYIINEFQDDTNTTTHARTIMFDNGATCIHIRKLDHGTIAHEVFHAIQFLMDKIGCNLTQESGEPYAYLVQYVTNKIYENLE